MPRSDQQAELPLKPLPDLLRWFRSRKTRGVIIGGVAVALIGRPRITRDLDAVVLVPEEDWRSFFLQARDFGFLPRISNALAFAAQSRVLLLRHEESQINIDISLGALPFEHELVDRAVTRMVARVRVPLPTPEDLVILKAVAHRPNDMKDIQGLVEIWPKMDFARVKRWVREFAEVLETPELLEDLEKLLAANPVSKKTGSSRHSRRRSS